MKSLLVSLVLISLCSCGGSSGSKTQAEGEQSFLSGKNSEGFTLPQINFQSSVTIDSDITSIYEEMIIAQPSTNVLGNRAFYIMINGNMYPSYDEMDLGFYSSTKVNSIYYFDAKDKSTLLRELDLKKLSSIKLKEVSHSYRNRLSWGKKNLDAPEFSMLNKAYVIKTENMDEVNRVEYKAESTYLIWFECTGKLREVDDLIYACEKYNLKFNYKLIDYKLSKK